MLPSIHAITLTETDSSAPRRRIPARLRRVNRAHENDPELVTAAIPRGCVRAAHGDQVMARLLAILSERRMRSDGHRARVAVLTVLIARADYETMTTRPGWEALAEAAGCTTRSVARILAQLEAWGLLGRVAGGRQARYAAAGPDGERINEAAVYVLCVPSPLALVPAEPEADVDINVIPPALGGSHLLKKKLTPTRARERASKDAATPRGLESAAASDGSGPVPPYRQELYWPSHRTTTRKIQRLAAATEIWHRTLVFRRMSHKDLASSLKEAFLTGWTVSDVLNALSWKPDGTRWADSGAPDVSQDFTRHACSRLRGWIKSRLDGWRTAQGELLRSPDQRAAAEHRENTARQAMERRRVLEEQAQRAAQIAEGHSLPLPWRIRFAELIEEAAHERAQQFPSAE